MCTTEKRANLQRDGDGGLSMGTYIFYVFRRHPLYPKFEQNIVQLGTEKNRR